MHFLCAVMLPPLLLATVAAGFCSVQFDAKGQFDFTATLFRCSENITDVDMPYNFVNNSYIQIVNTQVNLNNFFDLDELDGTVKLDMSFRISWYDPRWYIPGMFDDYIGEEDKRQGIIFEKLVSPLHASSRGLRFWIPDLIFRDVVGQEELASVYRFRDYGEIYVSKRFMLTLGQPQLDFTEYPMDSQVVNVVFHPFACNIDQCMLRFMDTPVVYVSSDAGEVINFEENFVWTHSKNDYTAETEVVGTTFDEESGSGKLYSLQTISLHVSRDSDGVVLRFIAPVCLLSMVAGMVYWMDPSERVGTTLNLLVTVSALYIVIFGNIPLTGQLNRMDIYIIEMFLIIIISIGVHQISYRLSEKAASKPVRGLTVRFLEFSGRMTIIPVSIVLFFDKFPSPSVEPATVPVYTILAILFFGIGVREVEGVRKGFIVMMFQLNEKRQLGKSEPGITLDVSERFFLWIHGYIYGPDAKFTEYRDSTVRNSLSGIEIKSPLSANSSS